MDLDFLLQSIMMWFANPTLMLMKWAVVIYNALIKHAANLLLQSPSDWSAEGWNAVSLVYDNFKIVGSACVVIFYLYGFCMETIDAKQEMQLFDIIKSYLKICIAEFFVEKGYDLISKVFLLVPALIGKFSPNATELKTDIPDEITKMLMTSKDYDIGAGDLIVLFIIAIIFFVVLAVTGAIIAYQAYVRFFRIMVLIPYGALANSTIAGSRGMMQVAGAYWKYALATILEAVTMLVSLYLFGTILGGGEVSLFAESESNSLYIVEWMIQTIFLSLVCVGVTQGAEKITQKALGL